MFSATSRAPSLSPRSSAGSSTVGSFSSTGSGSSSGARAGGAGALGRRLGVADDVGGSTLGGVDDRAHLLGGRRRQRLARPPRRLGGLGLQLLDLRGDPAEMALDCVGVVAAAADGKVLLLDV